MGDGLTAATASVTCAANGEETLGSSDLSGSTALCTDLRRRSGLTAAAPTSLTSFGFFDLYIGFRPKSRLHEAEGHVIAKICPPLSAASGSPTAAEAKEILKNVTKT